MTDIEPAELTAKRLQAIGGATRIRIIDVLLSGTKSVGELATILKVEIVNISHHLSVLQNAGIIKGKKRGRFVDYTLNAEIFKETKGGMEAELGWCRMTLGK